MSVADGAVLTTSTDLAPLAFRTLPFDALGFTFDLSADDEAIVRYLDRVFAALRSSDPTAHSHYDIRALPAPLGGDSYELTRDRARLATAPTAEGLIRILVHHINQRAVSDAHHVVLHAGGVAWGDVGVVFPAPMEAGKTTLVTGLVRAGFDYLTDEAVAIDRGSLRIQPYPKPLSIDPGSWPLFPRLEPHEDLATDDYKAEQWQVPADAIRPGAVGRPCPIGVVVFPRYEAGAETVLAPMGRAEGLIEMAKSTFMFNRQSREALDLLAAVVRRAECYRLSVGELDTGVESISRLVGATPLGGEPR